jgi:hypothetical protein
VTPNAPGCVFEGVRWLCQQRQVEYLCDVPVCNMRPGSITALRSHLSLSRLRWGGWEGGDGLPAG